MVVEATTMRNDIKAAFKAGYIDIHIKGENKIPILAVHSEIQAP